jgi:hypothetical protein
MPSLLAMIRAASSITPKESGKPQIAAKDRKFSLAPVRAAGGLLPFQFRGQADGLAGAEVATGLPRTRLANRLMYRSRGLSSLAFGAVHGAPMIARQELSRSSKL